MDSNKIVVDTSLLDDICGRWIEGNKFCFGGEGGRLLEIDDEKEGLILNVPYKGHPIELNVGSSTIPF